MSIVVSDSGPIHYLVLCEAIEIVPKLYGQLRIPSAVRDELTHPNAPSAVSHWISSLPPWATFRSASQIEHSTQLGKGEAEAIALALELKASLLLVDDRVARRIATERGLLTAGTVTLLELGASRGLLDLPSAFQKLTKTNFRIRAEVLQEALDRNARKSKPITG